jgi:Spy/CpxP family protein refolding chaperone
MKKAVYRIILVVALLGAGYGVYRYFKGMSVRQQSIPVTKVRRGDVVVRSFTRGEIRAVRVATLTAPNLFGTVQVTRLAPLGSLAREKNLVVEFDDSEVQSRLESRQLELEGYDEQIKKAQADLAIKNNEDEVDLLKARYNVRRAQLEVQKNELVSVIDQKKNKLNLEEAQRRLKQLESDIKSKQEQALAELNVLREKRNRSVLDINREKMRLMQVKLLAPIAGLVSIKQNRSGFSGMFGTQVPDIREGDQVQPGIPVAEVLDLSELEVIARVGELDRANLHEGQDVLIRLDALAGKVYNGKIKSMSGTASANVFSSDPGKKFDVLFSIDMKQLLGSLGAKPDQVARILATAEENRKKPITTTTMSMLPGGLASLGQGGGGPQMSFTQGGGGQPMAMAQPGAGDSGGRRPGGGGMLGGMMSGANLTPDQQKKLSAIMQKATRGKNLMELSQEERQKVFTTIREEAKKAGIELPQRGRRDGGAAAGGFPGLGAGTGSQFSQKDLDAAELPAPPEEGDNTEILVRPGLLADVEIIVEKVPNAVYVPNQAIFEKDGKSVVYVKGKKGDVFEPRFIGISKRSESVSVIASGLKDGEVVALQDPTATAGEKKKKEEKKSSGATSALPVGASKGGQ